MGLLVYFVWLDIYVKIDNFYIVMVYEKGVEVICMMNIILGEDGFCKGMDFYFECYDGRVVMVDEFVVCMEEVNDYDLK